MISTLSPTSASVQDLEQCAQIEFHDTVWDIDWDFRQNRVILIHDDRFYTIPSNRSELITYHYVLYAIGYRPDRHTLDLINIDQVDLDTPVCEPLLFQATITNID